MEGAQNHQVQYQKPTFSGLKGQQKRSGVAGPRPALLFEMENRRFSYASGQMRPCQLRPQEATLGGRKSTALGGLSFSGFLTKTEPSPASGFQVFQGSSRFFSVFMFFYGFYVFQDISEFVTLNSDGGPPPRPFHSLVLVKGGLCFSILKAK